MDTTDKMIEDFKKALDSMPQDEFEKMVQEIDAMKMTGPTVEEYFDHISGSPRKIAALQKELSEGRGRIERLEAGWVSVSERLPEKPCEYLVAAPLSDKILVTVLGYYGEWIDRQFGHIKETKVTHWRPLPEPPKI